MLNPVLDPFQVSQKLKQHSAEPFKLPAASEQVIADLAKNSEDFAYKTPPSSPGGSSVGSRKSSMCSISSAGSNSSLAHPLHFGGQQQQTSPGHMPPPLPPGGGPATGAHAHSATLRSHRLDCLLFTSYFTFYKFVTLSRSMSHAVAAANNLGPQMMRLSSISSQDSGFTSQDTLFLRPGSPSNRSKVGDFA